jgi:hypothetical protein
MIKKNPNAFIEKILEKIEKVGYEFENHPDFKEALSF